MAVDHLSYFSSEVNLRLKLHTHVPSIGPFFELPYHANQICCQYYSGVHTQVLSSKQLTKLWRYIQPVILHCQKAKKVQVQFHPLVMGGEETKGDFANFDDTFDDLNFVEQARRVILWQCQTSIDAQTSNRLIMLLSQSMKPPMMCQFQGCEIVDGVDCHQYPSNHHPSTPVVHD